MRKGGAELGYIAGEGKPDEDGVEGAPADSDNPRVRGVARLRSD